MIKDTLLILRCKHGSRTAFKRIYKKYEGDLRTLAANLLDDKASAEDIVHDVFISFLSIVEKFELRRSLAGFLKTCVANRARNYAKKKQNQARTIRDAEKLTSKENEPIRLVIQNEQRQES